MDKRNWMQMQKSKSKTLIERYKISTLYSTIKSLPLQVFITAVSSFCGPIAILYDKSVNHQFVLPENFINSIIIVNCKGQLIKTIPYNYKQRIIFMKFTKYEELLIIQASGDYWFIDAFSGKIIQGNYTASADKQQKYRGCQLLGCNKLILIRQKQLGITSTITEKWQPLPDLKIKVQNPLFYEVFNSPQQFIYLSRLNQIQQYNVSTGSRRIIYADSFLYSNWQNLLTMSYFKQKNLLGLVYKNPSVIFYIDLAKDSNTHRKFDVMTELKYDLTSSNSKGLTSKYVSKSFYKPLNYTLSWLDSSLSFDEHLQELKQTILVFGNPRILVMFDGQAAKLTLRSNCNQLVSVQKDCIRVYTQDTHEIYRVVPYLYQTITQIGKINEGYYNSKFQNIIKLHDEYTNYLQKNIIDLSKFNNLWKMGNRGQVTFKDSKPANLQNQNDQIDKSNSYFLNKENTPQTQQQIYKIEQKILKPLINAVKFCIDPVDQVKMLKFIFFIKNLYTSPILLFDLCEQMRIINNLKFELLSRTLTINQFQYLKFEQKDRFLTILLRYRMHFIADVIFEDSDSKYKIFLHWSKCKIQKNTQAMSFEQIKEKFVALPKKYKNSKVFTDIAKYSLDRGKQGLAEKLIQLQQNPQRKILIYLLMLSTTSDKKVVEKLLNAAQQSTKSFLIYRVIRQLLQSQENFSSSWINILYGKPNIARHFIRYLKAHGNQQKIKNYYFQNKDYDDLGYYGIEKIVQQLKNEDSSLKYNEQFLNSFIPKIEDFKKFLPALSSAAKSLPKNIQMQLLRKIKNTDYTPSQQQLKQVKNDIVLQYIGQILIQKQRIEAALSAFRKIKSQKIFSILMRKQKYIQSINLAFERKNKQALAQIKQKSPSQLHDLINEKIETLMKK